MKNLEFFKARHTKWVRQNTVDFECLFISFILIRSIQLIRRYRFHRTAYHNEVRAWLEEYVRLVVLLLRETRKISLFSFSKKNIQPLRGNKETATHTHWIQRIWCSLSCRKSEQCRWKLQGKSSRTIKLAQQTESSRTPNPGTRLSVLHRQTVLTSGCCAFCSYSTITSRL